MRSWVLDRWVPLLIEVPVEQGLSELLIVLVVMIKVLDIVENLVEVTI
jgi:hypothetical protein